MTDGKKRGDGRDADLEGLARRFQDLWQDQLAAMAADPDFAEMMGKWFGAGAGVTPGGFPGFAPGAAAPFGQMDPAAWLKALGIEAKAAGAGRNETANDPTAARAGSQSSARATSTAPTGATSTSASSGSGDVAGDQFERRFADLEQRLDRLEATLGATRRSPAKGTRKRRS